MTRGMDTVDPLIVEATRVGTRIGFIQPLQSISSKPKLNQPPFFITLLCDGDTCHRQEPNPTNQEALNAPTGPRFAGLYTALSSSLTPLEGVSLKPCPRPQSVKSCTSNPCTTSEAGETAEDHGQQAPAGR
eukprot:CAMPEP_0172161810 /NCGR_PEP_ID=MMETSP1050-20130122/6325_1 /TAXON_ID=233186 /ORGANISM="Cryptomonas curvata, Strain CCAP979/52" /LENGTH=130 /DNA_ID=CAMNT_0012831735 /DNA_START=561 /DNA_END=949 /DNA_ORIENTATION=+